MPKIAAPLSDMAVKKLKHPGTSNNPIVKAVGGVAGLHIQVTPTGAKSWLLRLSVNGKRRDMGLGPYPEVSLTAAREHAATAKAQARQGTDPIAERKAVARQAEAEARRTLLFKDALDQYCKTKLIESGSEKHRKLWRNSVETYAVPVIGNMAMDEVTMQDVLQVLEPIWHTKTTTADRVRDRIRTIFDWASVKGHFTGRNPAAWQGNLKFVLPSPGKIHKVEHKPALAIADAPSWFAHLREREGLPARALEFLALTAVRNGEVLGATWDEIQGDMWVIPAERMKMNKEHRVPLSVAAQTLLKDLPRTEGTNLIFPSRVRTVMGDARTSDLMKDISEAHGPFNDPQTGRRAVPHGLRSTFHNTCTEAGWDHNLIEMALAHDIGTAVTRAYMRTDMVEKHRQLMEFWSGHLAGVASPDNVVELRA